VPRAFEKCGAKSSFLAFLWVKPALLAQTQVETLTINTTLPHLEILVQKCGSSTGKQLWSFMRVFYVLLDFLGHVFIFSNSFYLPCITKSF